MWCVFFHGIQKGGFFIECGSTNGERASNTIYMEQKMDWTGLLIEVDPYFFLQLIGHNRKSYSLNACLSTHRRIATVWECTHHHSCYMQMCLRQLTCIFGTTHQIKLFSIFVFIHSKSFQHLSPRILYSPGPVLQKETSNLCQFIRIF